MKKLDRRDFLKTSSLASIGVLSSGKAWSLATLEPISDTLRTDYPYRGWEDVYRNEYEHNVVGYAAHCVNILTGYCGPGPGVPGDSYL